MLLGETRPKARKGHGCDACGGWITAGDTYLRQRGVDGSDLWTWKGHQLCAVAYDQVSVESDRPADEGASWDEIREKLRAFFAAVMPRQAEQEGGKR